MKSVMVLLVILGLWSSPSGADIITEIGAGYKIPASTSVLMLEDCHEAQIVETRPDRPDLNFRTAGCGGDNPVFVGWPVAWDFDLDGPWSARVGWFHYSHWFDGKSKKELHMDLAAVTFTVNWSELRERRTVRRRTNR